MTVRLRPLGEDDLRRIYDWQRDPELYRHLVGNRRDVSWPEARDWMRRHWLPPADDRRYALCAGPDGRHIGNVYLLAAKDEPGTREFHVFIAAEPDRGRGHGRAALAAALDIAFGELEATAVRLQVLESNGRARAIYAAAGFRETGAPEVVDKAGKPDRALAMRLTRQDYGAARTGAR